MLRIRQARPEDDASLAAIDAATWVPEVSPAPSPEHPAPFFDERTSPEQVLVAEDDADGAVLGYVKLTQELPLPSHAHVLEVAGLAVAPGRQGGGVGRALVEAAVAEAGRRRARKLSLRVLGSNPGARRLYERCGFVVEGVLREEFRLAGEYVDDVLMARYLTGEPPR